MALQSSGAISLNDIHIEAGGSSGTLCTINDSDIRALIGKTSGATSSFNQFYGASSVSYSAFASWAATNYPSVLTGGYNSGSGRVQAGCVGSMWGSPANSDTSSDSEVRFWSYHSIQYATAASYITSGSRYVVYARGGYTGYGAVYGATVHSCTSSSWDPWDGYQNNCWYYDSYLNAYRKMTTGRGSFSNFTGP